MSGVQLDLLTYKRPAPSTPADRTSLCRAFLDLDEAEQAEWTATLPSLDGDTWWCGFVFGDGPDRGWFARIAPVIRQPHHTEAYWHMSAVELAPDDEAWCVASIKPITRYGLALQFLHAGLDIRRVEWRPDDEHHGPVDATAHYLPGRDPDMYWGNPFVESPLEAHGNRAARRTRRKGGGRRG